MTVFISERKCVYVEGHGVFSRASEMRVICQQQRGKYYTSVNTMNASRIGVGDTESAAYADWEKQTGLKTSAK